jgi:hypothetical protein
MGLPIPVLRTRTVTVEGDEYRIQALTRKQAMALQAFADTPEAGEVYLLAKGLNVPEAEVDAWREVADFATVEIVLEAIVELSGLSKDKDADPQLGTSKPS